MLVGLLLLATLALGFQDTPAHAAPGAVAKRIVVLVPGHAAILDALGVADALVLVPRDPGLTGVAPEADRFRRQPSVEGMLAKAPTLVIGGNPVRDRELLSRLASLGVATVMIERSLPAVERIKQLADLVNRNARATALIERIRADYGRAVQLAKGESPVRVLHISSTGAGSSGAVTAAGNDTAADRLIHRAGAINAGAQAGLERYQSISAEGMIAMAPEAVVVSAVELDALGGRKGIWQRVPGLEHTPAARHDNLIVLSHGAIKYNAVQSGSGALALVKALYAR